MNPWFAAMIPLAIILVLGSIAFFIGYKGYLSNDNDTDQDSPPARTVSKQTPSHQATSNQATSDQVRPNTSAANRQAALRQAVSSSDRLILRASHERAVLVQFIDLYSPGTISVQEFLANLRTDYSRRVTFVTRHLPTTDDAYLAASALEAADRQGYFIQYLEALTLDPEAQERPRLHASITADTYLMIARELGLNGDRFEADMNSEQVRTLIDSDKAEAAHAGVTRAPALILLDDQNHNTLTSLQDFREAVRLVAR